MNVRKLLPILWILILAALVGAIAAAATQLMASDSQFIYTALQMNTDQVQISQSEVTLRGSSLT